MPADGFFGSFGFPPAYWANAARAPPVSTSKAPPNAPLQSVMIATLIGEAAERAASDVPATTPAIATTANGSITFHIRALVLNLLPSRWLTLFHLHTRTYSCSRGRVDAAPPFSRMRPVTSF